MSLHLKETINSISINQWIGLILSLIASTLAWLKLIFIVGPSKNNKPNIGKYQLYALLIGWVITFIVWARLLAVVDPLNNNKKCDCKNELKFDKL